MNEKNVYLLDLFSGVGGFALAAEIANAMAYIASARLERSTRESVQRRSGRPSIRYRPIAHSEIEPFACSVYHRHFPDSVCLGAVQHVTRDAVLERCGTGEVGIIAAGFPCQPFSCAGKRKGKDDERHLWPQLAEAVCDIRSRFCLFENVRGLLTAKATGRLSGWDYRRRRIYWHSQVKQQAQELLLRHDSSWNEREGFSDSAMAETELWRDDSEKQRRLRQMGGILQLAYLRGVCGEPTENAGPDAHPQVGAGEVDLEVCGDGGAEAARAYEASMDAGDEGQRGEVQAGDPPPEHEGSDTGEDLGDGPETTGWVFGDILRDLADIGYACLWQVVPASAVGAPHRRERVWLLCFDELADAAGTGPQAERGPAAFIVGHADSGSTPLLWPALDGCWPSRPGEPQHGWEPPRVVANSESSIRRWAGRANVRRRWLAEAGGPDRSEAGRPLEPALGCRADGLPAAVGGDWPQVHNRVAQLKGFGNAIVPEVAAPFLNAILRDIDAHGL